MIQTLEEARSALENIFDAISAAPDDPSLNDVDVIECVALDCTPSVAIELCRVEIGWVPTEVHRYVRQS